MRKKKEVSEEPSRSLRCEQGKAGQNVQKVSYWTRSSYGSSGSPCGFWHKLKFYISGIAPISSKSRF